MKKAVSEAASYKPYRLWRPTEATARLWLFKKADLF